MILDVRCRTPICDAHGCTVIHRPSGVWECKFHFVTRKPCVSRLVWLGERFVEYDPLQSVVIVK